MKCQACIEQYKDGHKFLSEPLCAWDTEGGVFDNNNWMCASLIAVRNKALDMEDYMTQIVSRSEEQSCLCVPMADTGSFGLLSWYKQRGRTELALFIGAHTFRLATLADWNVAIARIFPDGVPIL